jgi:ankyrin repeat protein
MASMRNKTTSIPELLLKRKGIDVDATDASGATALHVACIESPDLKLVQRLVKKKANLNVTGGDGERLLVSCVASGRTDAAMLLIKGGADTQIKNCDGVLFLYCVRMPVSTLWAISCWRMAARKRMLQECSTPHAF